MQFEWDERKRQINLKKHRLDFADAGIVFSGVVITILDNRFSYGEDRWFSLGLLDDVVVAIAHTDRKTISESSQCERQQSMNHKSISHKSQKKPTQLSMAKVKAKTKTATKSGARARNPKTPLAALRQLGDKDIDFSEIPPITPEMFARGIVKRGLKPVMKKDLLTIRIDSDVLKWFKAHGRGYQTQINALLREYMQANLA